MYMSTDLVITILPSKWDSGARWALFEKAKCTAVDFGTWHDLISRLGDQ